VRARLARSLLVGDRLLPCGAPMLRVGASHHFASSVSALRAAYAAAWAAVEVGAVVSTRTAEDSV